MEMLKIILPDDRSPVYVNVDKVISIGPVDKSGFRIPVFYKHKCYISTTERNYTCLCTSIEDAVAGKGFDVEKKSWYKDERSFDIIEDTLYTTADGVGESRTDKEMVKFQKEYEENNPRNR